jgi:hypothetical protein
MYMDPLPPLCRGGEADETSGCRGCPCPQNTARPQDASDFGQQSILHCFGRDMMKHSETHGTIECRVGEGHGRCILLNYGDIVAAHTA